MLCDGCSGLDENSLGYLDGTFSCSKYDRNRLMPIVKDISNKVETPPINKKSKLSNTTRGKIFRKSFPKEAIIFFKCIENENERITGHSQWLTT